MYAFVLLIHVLADSSESITISYATVFVFLSGVFLPSTKFQRKSSHLVRIDVNRRRCMCAPFLFTIGTITQQLVRLLLCSFFMIEIVNMAISSQKVDTQYFLILKISQTFGTDSQILKITNYFTIENQKITFNYFIFCYFWSPYVAFEKYLSRVWCNATSCDCISESVDVGPVQSVACALR